MKPFISLLIAFILFIGPSASETISVDQPNLRLPDTQVFLGLSNSSLPSNFLDCGDPYYKVWILKVTYLVNGFVSTCQKTNAKGICTLEGDTGGPTMEAITSGQTLVLGKTSVGYLAHEVNSSTKYTGDVKASRWCVESRFVQ